jgi:hypothetical protein
MIKSNNIERIKSAKNPLILKSIIKTADKINDFAENIINTVREPLLAIEDITERKLAEKALQMFIVLSAVMAELDCLYRREEFHGRAEERIINRLDELHHSIGFPV